MKKHVAVIATDIIDFQKWLTERKLENGKFDSQMNVIHGDVTYHCIYKPTHLISLNLTEIMETKNAKKNDAYSSITSQLIKCLK